jgi:hypothetical protein
VLRSNYFVRRPTFRGCTCSSNMPSENLGLQARDLATPVAQVAGVVDCGSLVYLRMPFLPPANNSM